MRILLVFLIVSAIALTVKAQEEPVVKRKNLEIKIGFNTFGPVHKMDKLMVENDFDESTSNWFTGAGLVSSLCQEYH
ncbi:MAG: hypothetical protein A2Z69_01660 [Bacteroidetes bacterium RBG_13_44_24]|nr:MAG: hypothetical protein A2Z69_01660 [Bacteroidetes bacterium RBG_13_44_24]